MSEKKKELLGTDCLIALAVFLCGILLYVAIMTHA